MENNKSYSGAIKKQPIWTCSVERTNEIPIDKLANVNNLQGGSESIDCLEIRLQPFIIKEISDGKYENKYYYVGNSNQNAFHNFKLEEIEGNDVSLLSEVFLYPKPWFPIEFEDLPDMFVGQISQKKVNSDNYHDPVNTMTIKFNPPENTDHPYVLYCNEEPVPPVLSLEENTSVFFQIKESLPDGSVMTLDPTSVKKNSGYIPDYKPHNDDKAIVNDQVPSYSEPNQQIEVKVEIEVQTSPTTTSIFPLTFLIEITPGTPDWGYDIIPLPSGVTLVDNNGCPAQPEQRVQNALDKILMDRPELYNTVFGSNEIDIVLSTPEIDSKLKPGAGTNSQGYSELLFVCDLINNVLGNGIPFRCF